VNFKVVCIINYIIAIAVCKYFYILLRVPICICCIFVESIVNYEDYDKLRQFYFS